MNDLHNLGSCEQRQVLALVRTLAQAAPRGLPGRELLAFAGVIDKKDLEAIRVALEERCEGVGSIDDTSLHPDTGGNRACYTPPSPNP